MLTILHLSDLHFGPAYRPELGEAVQRLAKVSDPDIIVASGDFTMRARREQFEEARAFLDRLPDRPLIVTPGNHDIPLYRIFERLLSPVALYREYISDSLDTVYSTDDAVIVALDSTSPLRSITNGRLSQRQIDMAASAFRAAPSTAIRIVVTHHNLAPAPDYEGSSVMHRAPWILESLSAIGTDLVLSGHLHRAYSANSLALYEKHPPGRGIRIIQAGTATSSRGRGAERGRNSVNLIRVSADSVELTPYIHIDELGDFAPAELHYFPRAGYLCPDTYTWTRG